MPRPSAMTYVDKVLRPCACLDIVLQASASLDTVPRPSSLTCLEKVPRSSAFRNMVPRPSAMTFLDKTPRPSACLGIVP